MRASVVSVAGVKRSLVSMQQRIECVTRRRALPLPAAQRRRLAVGLDWKKRGNNRRVGRSSLQYQRESALCKAATKDLGLGDGMPAVVPPTRRPGQPPRDSEEQHADISMREVKPEVESEEVMEVKRMLGRAWPSLIRA